jgi:hypothetical protein
MMGDWIDDIARALAAGHWRRALLRRLGAGLASALLGLPG